MKVLTVNITSVVHEGEWTGSEGKTGIDKRAVSGAISFALEQLDNDVIVDRKHHGGYHQAVYAYAREDTDWWEKELGITIDNGRFGENLTTLGIDVNASIIGEQWKIGSTVLEVSQPRIPCRVFAGFWNRPTLIKEFMAAGKPGTYLRIIQEAARHQGKYNFQDLD
jgi:MOSC domain-containing protein YiiM